MKIAFPENPNRPRAAKAFLPESAVSPSFLQDRKTLNAKLSEQAERPVKEGRFEAGPRVKTNDKRQGNLKRLKARDIDDDPGEEEEEEEAQPVEILRPQLKPEPVGNEHYGEFLRMI